MMMQTALIKRSLRMVTSLMIQLEFLLGHLSYSLDDVKLQP